MAKKRRKGGDCPAGAAKRAQQAYRGAGKQEHTDVLGSYTGLPEDGGVPVQDADDL